MITYECVLSVGAGEAVRESTISLIINHRLRPVNPRQIRQTINLVLEILQTTNLVLEILQTIDLVLKILQTINLVLEILQTTNLVLEILRTTNLVLEILKIVLVICPIINLESELEVYQTTKEYQSLCIKTPLKELEDGALNITIMKQVSCR